MYTASAFAVNTVFRCAFGAAFPLFTTAMFDEVRMHVFSSRRPLIAVYQMGVNWACTLLGLVSILLCPIPMVFFKFGAKIRGDSYFSPGIVGDLS